MTGQEWPGHLGAGIFGELYGKGAEAARERWGTILAVLAAFAEKPVRCRTAGTPRVIHDFPELWGGIRLFSAPGRTELAGNHTDHNNGKVLAASVGLDVAAAAAPREDSLVIFRSTGYPDAVLDLGSGGPDLEPVPAERGTTEALIRGIAAQFAGRGFRVGGFTAGADSAIFAGSGLSSSAAVEVLIAKIFDSFYGPGNLSPEELAKMGWKAENGWFGKPSGLMDQIACASGGVVAIDFEDPENPRIAPLTFDPGSLGYAICAVRTGGSHADLTDDYAAIPREMRKVAAFFGKKSLRECSRNQVLESLAELRQETGDRAVLRALHYFGENSRVDDMKTVLEKLTGIYDIEEQRSVLGRFLGLAAESGASSQELLQNLWPPADPSAQGLSLALALSRNILGRNGVARVHGGGFAGAIQAYVPLASLERYRVEMEAVFGAGAVTALTVRQRGVMEILPG